VSAGISAPPADEVAALVDRLRDALTQAPGGAGDEPKARLAAARQQAERVWAVSAERLVVRRPGPKGTLTWPLKRGLQRLLRWYVEPFAAEQREVNDALLKAVDALSALVDGLAGRADAIEEDARDQAAAAEAAGRRLTELEERLTRVERRLARDTEPRSPDAEARLRPDARDTVLREQAGASPPPPGPAAAVPDYFAFESRMRGSTDDIRERQRVYVDDLRDAAPVVDLGCGRGELLSLLREAGVEARGVDLDPDMVAFARGEGLDVVEGDAVGYLEGLDDGSLGGVFAAQLVEHLPAPALVRLLALAARKLRPGGVLVAETINPLSPLALRSYFADLTHAQPLVPETLELLARQSGFASVETRFLHPPEDVPDVPERVREILFAPLDYAIVART